MAEGPRNGSIRRDSAPRQPDCQPGDLRDNTATTASAQSVSTCREASGTAPSEASTAATAAPREIDCTSRPVNHSASADPAAIDAVQPRT